jgi:PKD repeat protein
MANNCRSIDVNISISIPGENEDLEVKEAWILAPDIGKIQIAAYDQFLIRRGWLSITGGTVGGKSVDDIINPLVADFQANILNGYAPLTVEFTDLSTGQITSWLWNFGDGTTSTEHNPAHVYDTAGIYTVNLSINGPDGSDSTAKGDYINVQYAAPVAAFSADKKLGIAPLTVSFDEQCSGVISGWSWIFGDGSESTIGNPVHVYNQPGEYSVSLTATGPGGENTVTKTNFIIAAKPEADINNDNEIGLIDAMLILRALVRLDSQLTDPQSKDISGDGKIGLEEVIYLLNLLSY